MRLIRINALELGTKKGKNTAAFIEKELKNSNLIVETRKKEKYGWNVWTKKEKRDINWKTICDECQK